MDFDCALLENFSETPYAATPAKAMAGGQGRGTDRQNNDVVIDVMYKGVLISRRVFASTTLSCRRRRLASSRDSEKLSRM